MLSAKIVTAGPRGNKCRKCEEKVKAPDLLVRAHGEFNRHSGHQKIDNFCAKCGLEELISAKVTIKSMIETLTKGPSEDQPVVRKVRSV
jgi:hypothetical protein